MSIEDFKKLHTFLYDTFLGMYAGFLGGLDGKKSACSVGDLGSIPGLGRSLEEAMATHSSIPAWRIPMDKGAW